MQSRILLHSAHRNVALAGLLIGGVLSYQAGAPSQERPASPVHFSPKPIAFSLDSSETPQRHAPETMAGGVAVFDYDRDGKPDIFFTNGADINTLKKSSPRYWNRLFHNNGNGTFTDVTEKAGLKGTGFDVGVAIGDYDNDGALDVLISNNGGAPLLLHNEVGRRNSWVGIRLIGEKCNIDAVGAVVRWSAGGKEYSRLKIAGGSFLSYRDPRMILGLAGARKLDWVEVKWPLLRFALSVFYISR